MKFIKIILILILIFYQNFSEAEAGNKCSEVFIHSHIDINQLKFSQLQNWPIDSIFSYLDLAMHGKNNAWKEPWQNETTEHPWTSANFTDPKFHSDKNFMYLVHASKRLILSQTILDLSRSHDQHTSTSVISDSFTGTIARSGFIISSPSENIVETSYHDSSTFSYDHPYYRSRNGVIKPEEIIAQSGWSMNGSKIQVHVSGGKEFRQLPTMLKREYSNPDSESSSHNEIVIAAEYHHRDGYISRPTVIGIFVKAGVAPASKEEMSAAQELSRTSGLPLIIINETRTHVEFKID